MLPRIVLRKGLYILCGPGSVVGVATGMGWTVRGSIPVGGKIFCICPDWR
jgi:hypothetical protein